ncbi:MAG: preprotein translocase subunit SecG [Bdellovibrionales bacterium]|nr:preprotein translocase subunit SecG [Bdellovibrionales bacterium]
MIAFVSIIHALTCIFIILFILLQDPKGGVLGSLAGGSSRSFFGSDGGSSFLVKITKWLAVFFACSSFYLSYKSSKNNSIMDNSTVKNIESVEESNSESTKKDSSSNKEKNTTNSQTKTPTQENSDTNQKKTIPLKK